MAKSLRSKKVQRNKVLKRQSVFGDVAAARERRIAERLHDAAIDEVLARQEQPAAVRAEADMEVEGEISQSSTATGKTASAASKKSGTGGWSKKRKVKKGKSKGSRK